MNLEQYRRKRRFAQTPEPPGNEQPAAGGNLFVVQYHQARRPHYDFRLEWDGALKSWAVPKGPCLDPKEKRLAVRVEDHPIEYAQFEGVIPDGEYGAGTVIVWDSGTWEPIEPAEAGFDEGRLKFRLAGTKLRGAWALVRMRPKPSDRSENWLLIKERDQEVVRLEEADILLSMPNSALSGRSIEEVAQHPAATWTAGQATPVEPPKPPKPTQASKTAKSLKPSQPPQSTPKSASAKSGLKRAKKGPFPDWIEPQLAHLAQFTPDQEDWIHEIKFDGYRLLAQIRQGKVKLWTRRRQNWTERFPGLVRALKSLDVEDAYLDGEVVALLPNGASSFALLQTAFREGRAESLIYYVFDLLYLNSKDLRELPLWRRKETLQSLLPPAGGGVLQFTEHFEGQGPEFFRQCCRFGLEGVISKRRDRPYRSGRNYDWLKSKCVQVDQFVVGGWTDPAGSRLGFGALVLGYYNADGELIYAGRVGTGFSESSLLELKGQLASRARDRSPFANLSDREAGKDFHWVEPELVAQVQFSNWTMDGLLWHPSFHGIREDVAAGEVVRRQGERATQAPVEQGVPQKASAPKSTPKSTASRSSRATNPLEDFRLTNPHRILYAQQGITKLDLATYYFEVSDWILPHLRQRPITLVRSPHGKQTSCFYQRHAGNGLAEAIHRVPIDKDGEVEDYLMVDDLLGLMSLVQIGVVEIHIWGSRCDQPEKPDRLIFDLDPSPEVVWDTVVQSAIAIRDCLAELGLASFVKTTGGAGLHLTVPLVRRHTWEEVKQFAKDVAGEFARRQPDLFTISASKSTRRGKIYIDYQRNNMGATAVAPFSTRAKARAPVSTPLAWDELVHARPIEFRLETVPHRLKQLQTDPWEGFWEVKQSITAYMKRRIRK